MAGGGCIKMLKDDLDVTAELAYLTIGDEERGRFEKSVQAMLDAFAAMDGIDVTDLEPTTHALLYKNRTRTDSPDCLDSVPLNNNPNALNEDLLNNAPETAGRLISIPNVL